MKISNIKPIILFSLVALIFCLPIFSNFHYWGQMDWDQFTFWNAVPRDTLIHYKQFPLWNPYVNGGNVLLAHPHSPFLSPLYIFVLIFGPVIGLKLEIIVYLFIGLVGMFLLARHLNLKTPSAYLCAAIFMLNAIYPLHLTEGHASWLPMGFIPWLFLFFLKSRKNKKHLITAIFFLSLIVLAGSIDVLMIFIIYLILYALLTSIQNPPYKPLLNLMIIFIGSFLLCAVKLFPMLDFLHDFPRQISIKYDHFFWQNLFQSLNNIFLNRNQALLDQLSPSDVSNKYVIVHAWHEYGAYVGILPIILFFIGLTTSFKKIWPLLLTGLICFIIALDNSLPINIYKLFHYIPFYSTFQVPSRFMLGFIFSLSLIAGQGLDSLISWINQKRITQKIYLLKYIPIILTILVFIDLLFVNSPIFINAFIVKPLEIQNQNPFSQKYNKINFYDNQKTTPNENKIISHSSIYPIYLSNHGILNGYEIVKILNNSVKISSDPDYKGEAYLTDRGEINAVKFSPNKVDLKLDSAVNNLVVLNQNYYKGWNVLIDNSKGEVVNYKGLIACKIDSGIHTVSFYYLPSIFIFGLFVSIASVLILIYILKKSNKSKYYKKEKTSLAYKKYSKNPFLVTYPIYIILLIFVILVIAMNPSLKRLSPDEAVFYYRELLAHNNPHDIALLKKTLYRQLDNENWIVRFNVAEVLGEIDDPANIDILWQITQKDEKENVREAAVEGMCLSENPSALKYLEKLINDKNPNIKKKAAECLIRFGDSTTEKSLEESFNSESDMNIKIHSAIALAQLHDKEKLNYCLDILLNNPEPKYRLLVAKYLLDKPRHLLPHPLIETPDIFLKAFNKETDIDVKIQIASILSAFKVNEGTLFLKKILSNSPDPFIQLKAISGLVMMRNKENFDYFYPFIKRLLNNESWEVREQTIEVIRKFDDAFIRTSLLEKILITDSNPIVREIAAWLMGERKNKNALKALEKGLYDTNPDVRTGSLAAMYKILLANK